MGSIGKYLEEKLKGPAFKAEYDAIEKEYDLSNKELDTAEKLKLLREKYAKIINAIGEAEGDPSRLDAGQRTIFNDVVDAYRKECAAVEMKQASDEDVGKAMEQINAKYADTFQKLSE